MFDEKYLRLIRVTLDITLYRPDWWKPVYSTSKYVPPGEYCRKFQDTGSNQIVPKALFTCKVHANVVYLQKVYKENYFCFVNTFLCITTKKG